MRYNTRSIVHYDKYLWLVLYIDSDGHIIYEKEYISSDECVETLEMVKLGKASTQLEVELNIRLSKHLHTFDKRLILKRIMK